MGQVPCRAGCSRCCIGPFPITILDVDSLQQGLRALPTTRRETIRKRAAEQAAAMQAAYPKLAASRFVDNWPDEELDRLAEQFAHLPCPALDDQGRCGIYAFRPLTCRSMGIPTDEGGLTVGACQVQTFVPIVRLSASLRAEEQILAEREATALDQFKKSSGVSGEELLLPYGFVSDPLVDKD